MVDYDGLRGSLMTPDTGTGRRTQAKIDMMRRKLNSQGVSRSRGRRFASETNGDKNIQGGFQNGFVANGGQDALPTNTHQHCNENVKRTTLSNRNGFLSTAQKTADSVDYSSLANEKGAVKEDRKLINSQLVFCKTQKDITWRDIY